MAKVVYRVRGIDVKTLDAADLKKAGVEGFTKTSFRKGEEVEVSDEVAEALLSGKFGKGFSVVTEEGEVETKAAKDAPAEVEANQEATGTPRAGKIKSSTP